MKSLEHYETIAANYINGNTADFRKALNKLSKKELLAFEGVLARNHFDGEYSYANNILHSNLKGE